MLQPTFFAALVAATASFLTPPPPIHLRISVTLLAPKAFLATAFFDAGAPQRGSMMVTLEQHTPRSGQKAAVHGLRMGMVRGAWFLHPIKNPGV